jgi:hypothetical protein
LFRRGGRAATERCDASHAARGPIGLENAPSALDTAFEQCSCEALLRLVRASPRSTCCTHRAAPCSHARRWVRPSTPRRALLARCCPSSTEDPSRPKRCSGRRPSWSRSRHRSHLRRERLVEPVHCRPTPALRPLQLRRASQSDRTARIIDPLARVTKVRKVPATPRCRNQSGRLDSNQRPLDPQSSALNQAALRPEPLLTKGRAP